MYRNELDKTWFAHDAAYPDSKAKRTISDKILKDRTYEIARNREYDSYQKALQVWSISFSIKNRIENKYKWTAS